MERQTTLGRTVFFDGVGLHGGQRCRLTLAPAEADTGIRWQRVDVVGRPIIPATVDNVGSTDRATTLRAGTTEVRTVEHVMAALAAMGVHNALVQLDGPEPPFADGAAAAFVRLVEQAGLVELDAPATVRRLTRPVWVSTDNAHIVALPATGFRISYTFVSEHPALPTQFAEHDVTPAEFRREIAAARTVGWLREVEALRRRGLALGITEDAAVVVGERELVHPMRFPNEVARHKVLDIIGDLALVGPFAAHIVAVRSGHRLHVELARRLVVQLTEEETNTV